MKKFFKNYLSWALVLPSLILFSCEDDSETTENVNPDQAKLEISMLADQMSSDIMQLTESDGVNGALDLLYLLEDFDFSARKTDDKSVVREKLHLIASYFVYGPSARVGTDDDEVFSFDDIKGLYVWNPDTEEFDKSASEFFVVLFPTEGSATNNAELKISKLKLITIMDSYDGYVDEYQLPTEIEAYLKIDEVEVITLDFLVAWSTDGFPDKAEVELFVSPFTFTLGFDQSFPQKSSLVTSILLDGEAIVGVDVDVEFESTAKEEVAIVEGFVQYYNLKLAGKVEVPSFEEEENGDINDFFDLELLLDDEKIGDIIFEEDLAYVVYADGSRELLEDIIEPIVADLEEFFEDFLEEDFD